MFCDGEISVVQVLLYVFVRGCFMEEIYQRLFTKPEIMLSSMYQDVVWL